MLTPTDGVAAMSVPLQRVASAASSLAQTTNDPYGDAIADFAEETRSGREPLARCTTPELLVLLEEHHQDLMRLLKPEQWPASGQRALLADGHTAKAIDHAHRQFMQKAGGERPATLPRD